MVQSEAFAPTPQFESVGRLDDNVLLRMRRDNIVGANSEEAKEVEYYLPFLSNPLLLFVLTQ